MTIQLLSTASEFQLRLALLLVVGSCVLSVTAASILLARIAADWYQRRHTHKDIWQVPPSKHGDSPFFIYLMIAELIHAISGLMNIRWAIDAVIDDSSSVCTVQGVLRQHSELGISFMSLFIAAKAFCVLVLRRYPSSSTTTCAIGMVFLLIALMQVIAILVRDYASGTPYYGNAGFGCWIGKDYGIERIVFGYLWMWIAAFLILGFYAIKIFQSYGNQTTLKGDSSQTLSSILDTEDLGEEEKQRETFVAKLTYLHPTVFLFCVLPISLVYWIESGGHHVSPGGTIFAAVLFSLSGFFNAIVYAANLKHPEPIFWSSIGRHNAQRHEDNHPTSHHRLHLNLTEKHTRIIIDGDDVVARACDPTHERSKMDYGSTSVFKDKPQQQLD